MKILGGAFFMAIKGQKFKHYPESVKREAIRLRVETKLTYREISEHLGIYDVGRMKKWMKKYKEEGELVFEDRRGNPFREETDEYRYVKRLKMENTVLKKWLAILNQEVYMRNGKW
jgi:transposase-like protein